MPTDLEVQQGMHITPDPATGAIAAAQPGEIEAPQSKDDQPEQTPKAEAEQTQEPINPRKAIMDKIYANRGESFKRELEYAAAVSMGATVDPILDESSPISDERQGETGSQQEQENDKPQQKVEKKLAEQAQEPKKKYIIAGQQVELTEKQLSDLASRTVTAEQRLQGAQQQIYQQPQQQLQPQPVQQQAPIQPEVDGRLKDIARKITYGSEEESTRALADLVGLTAGMIQRPQMPTIDQIVQAAAPQVVANLDFRKNLDTIASEYKDVFEKRSSTLVAADHVNTLRNRYAVIGMQKPDVELYREACELTREEFGLKSSTAMQKDQKIVAQPNLRSKLEQKRAAPQPAVTAHRVAQAPATNTIQTGSDIVARMRKSRGQSA